MRLHSRKWRTPPGALGTPSARRFRKHRLRRMLAQPWKGFGRKRRLQSRVGVRKLPSCMRDCKRLGRFLSRTWRLRAPVGVADRNRKAEIARRQFQVAFQSVQQRGRTLQGLWCRRQAPGYQRLGCKWNNQQHHHRGIYRHKHHHHHRWLKLWKHLVRRYSNQRRNRHFAGDVDLSCTGRSAAVVVHLAPLLPFRRGHAPQCRPRPRLQHLPVLPRFRVERMSHSLTRRSDSWMYTPAPKLRPEAEQAIRETVQVRVQVRVRHPMRRHKEFVMTTKI